MKMRTPPALVRACAFIRIFPEQHTHSSLASVPVIASSDTDECEQDPLPDVTAAAQETTVCLPSEHVHCVHAQDVIGI